MTEDGNYAVSLNLNNLPMSAHRSPAGSGMHTPRSARASISMSDEDAFIERKHYDQSSMAQILAFLEDGSRCKFLPFVETDAYVTSVLSPNNRIPFPGILVTGLIPFL